MNPNIQTFINRWQASGAAERANYQLFLAELCDVIGVAYSQPAVEAPHENAYVFEKRVPSAHGTTNFIDLYKRSCFVLEAKQGSDKAETGHPLPFRQAQGALSLSKRSAMKTSCNTWSISTPNGRLRKPTASSAGCAPNIKPRTKCSRSSKRSLT